MATKPKDTAAFKKGDRVKLVRLDGTVWDQAVEINDLFGGETSARNASYWYGNSEQFTHTDLLKREDDTSPVTVPDGGVWYIARGDNMGWGRAQTEKQAVANMRRQGGTVKTYDVHRVSKWTMVDGMGALTWPTGIEPVEIKSVPAKKKVA